MLSRNQFDESAHILGVKLEQDILCALSSIKVFDEVYDERQLVQQFGWQCGSIDTLAVFGNCIIPMQQKWRNSKRRETKDIDNFIKSIEFIQQRLGKKVLFGVWSSRMEPFADNKEKLKEVNVLCVSHFTSIDKLVNKTISVVQQQLSKHND